MEATLGFLAIAVGLPALAWLWVRRRRWVRQRDKMLRQAESIKDNDRRNR